MNLLLKDDVKAFPTNLKEKMLKPYTGN